MPLQELKSSCFHMISMERQTCGPATWPHMSSWATFERHMELLELKALRLQRRCELWQMQRQRCRDTRQDSRRFEAF